MYKQLKLKFKRIKLVKHDFYHKKRTIFLINLNFKKDQL